MSQQHFSTMGKLPSDKLRVRKINNFRPSVAEMKQ
jgi:hypothetical protein